MPNRKTHLVVGGIAGASTAAYCARSENIFDMIIETLGGGIGGTLSSALPDIIEPARNSWHRSLAHSVSTGAAGVLAVKKAVASWQTYCRKKAAHHDQLVSTSKDILSRIWHGLLALAWRILAGFVVGAFAGYISHLVLDATTPRRIPILA
jgi:hypothetical protein